MRITTKTLSRIVSGLVILVGLIACQTPPHTVNPPQAEQTKEMASSQPASFDGAMVIQQGHTESVLDLAYAPSGRFIASAAKDQTVRLWTPDGRLMRVIYTGIDIHSLAIFRDDRILLGGFGGVIAILSPEGRLLSRFEWAGQGYMVNTLALSPDETKIATGDLEGKVQLYDTAGKLLLQLAPPGKVGEVKSLAFTPDGRHLISGSNDGTIRVWTVEGKLERAWQAHSSVVSALAVHPQLNLLASGSEYIYARLEKAANKPKHVRLWRLDGTPVGDMEAASTERLAFTPNGRFLVSGDAFAGSLRIWRADGKLDHTIPISKHDEKSPYRMALSPDNRYIVEADHMFNPPTIAVWDLDGHRTATMRRLSARIQSVAFSPQGTQFATASLDNKVRVWSVAGRLLATHSTPGQIMGQLAYSPDGRFLAAVYEDLYVWDSEGKQLARVKAHKKGADGIAFTSDGRYLLTAGGDGYVNIYDLLKNTSRRLKISKDRINSIAVHPNGKLFATGGYGGDFQVWDFSGKRLTEYHVRKWPQAWGTPGPTYALAFSPDGKRLVMGSPANGRELCVFDLLSGKVVKEIATNHGPQWGTIAFSPSGRWLAVTVNNTVSLWDGRTYEPYGTFRGHMGIVNSLAFSQDERLLISGGSDGTTRLWNTATGNSAAMLADGKEWIMFTPDGYFDGSRYGGTLLSMVHGMDVYDIEQFALTYNRPDIIFQRLGIDAPELINHFHERYLTRLHRAGLAPTLSVGLHAPRARVVERKQEGKQLHLRLRFADDRYELKSYQIYANGVAIFPGEGMSLSGTATEVDATVELLSGENHIDVSAMNTMGELSLPASVKADYSAPVKGRLFFAAVGVSDYGDSRLNLHYAHKDALDLARALGSMKAGFSDVQVRTLTDAQATRQNILELHSFLTQAKVDDTVILFFAGHGGHTRDALATYYLIPHGASAERLQETAVSYQEIENLLADSPARRRLLLLDACESGELDPEQRQRMASAANSYHLMPRIERDASEDNAAAPRSFLYNRDRYIYHDLVRRSGSVVFSSSGGGEPSFESSTIHNGVFTYALLSALKSPVADSSRDGRISVDELVNYAANYVSAATGGVQNPTVDRDNPLQVIALPALRK